MVDFSKYQKKESSEPQTSIGANIPEEPFLEIIPPIVIDTKIKQNKPTKSKKDTINTPIRVMWSIVTQITMFDKDSKRLTHDGKNKKEIKAEIIALTNRLSEKKY